MILYFTAATGTRNLEINKIEARLRSGRQVLLTWDAAETFWQDGKLAATFKGIRLDGEPAEGKIRELWGMRIHDIQFRGAIPPANGFLIEKMLFKDGARQFWAEGGRCRQRLPGLRLADGDAERWHHKSKAAR